MPAHLTAPDGTRIAWRTEGPAAAAPAVAFCNGIANDAFQFRPLMSRLRGRARLLTWDYPGHGKSEPARDPARLDVGQLADLLVAVLDAAEIPAATLVGYSVGCQVVLEACRRHPGRTAALVLLLGTAGRPFDSFYGPRLGALAHRLLEATPAALVGAGLRLGARAAPAVFAGGRLLGVIEPRIAYGEWRPWLDHLGVIDGPTFRAMALATQRHTAADVLPSVHVPLLVIGGGKDTFTPPDRSREMHEQAPGSEYLLLPEATHSGLVGHAFEIGEAVACFLDRHGLVSPV